MTDGRYERLRAAVVTVLDAEIGDDVVALRQLLLDALDDECEAEFVEAMERVPVTFPDLAEEYPGIEADALPGEGTDGPEEQR